MRPIWTGSISFGLINIPMALFPAAQRDELKFRLLRASDLSPVNYQRIAEADGKEVPWAEIVKGYEFEKGKFVVLKEDDFKKGAERFRKARDEKHSREEVLKIIRKNKSGIKAPSKEKIARSPEVES